jgi:hypothetical protein
LAIVRETPSSSFIQPSRKNEIGLTRHPFDHGQLIDRSPRGQPATVQHVNEFGGGKGRLLLILACNRWRRKLPFHGFQYRR